MDVNHVALLHELLRKVTPDHHDRLDPRRPIPEPAIKSPLHGICPTAKCGTSECETAATTHVLAHGNSSVKELRIEEEDAGWPDKHMVIVSSHVLEVVLAVPAFGQLLNLLRRLPLPFRAKPPTERRDVASEREHDKEHSEEGARRSRGESRRYTR